MSIEDMIGLHLTGLDFEETPGRVLGWLVACRPVSVGLRAETLRADPTRAGAASEAYRNN